MATMPTMPTTSATAGAGAPPDTTPPAAGSPECTQLSTCCGGLMDEDDREDCQQLVERDDAERCMRASAELCQASAPTTPAMPGTACEPLSGCCSTLERPIEQRDCMETLQRNDAERCTRFLSRRCPELGPVPQEPACATLHACCPTLMEPRALELCRRALGDGDRRDCERAVAEICQ
jgi:hypothetical protein